ncbi:OmpA family protein [Aestuariibacter sp. AA17]|uniref:OmpA family protein n=1 Tax=Fluctibacter corallii TaxID=2984329 RepID=A0ABT3AD70_9ALTE|nr:OmpA family protein [Aestuariibacter sp. AA17]MCV2886608.1 OmpA family protein [Aestuariibacter sp. AA17]
MFKKLLLSSILLGITSVAAASEKSEGNSWVGGFFEYYNPDGDKPLPNGYLDDGEGYGAEFGYRFAPDWAARFEVSKVKLDIDFSRAAGITDFNDEGTRYGVDALYFVNDSATFLFSGLKFATYGNDHKLLNLGLGRHWKLSEKWVLVSEAAVYHDFGESHRDVGFKLGLAYTTGDIPTRSDTADDDRDGVDNGYDQCPNTPLGTAVDSNGCPLDSDKDGVTDEKDACPDTPAGMSVNERGCPSDADGDGVPNATDKCPNTPKGTKVGKKGCALSLDSDQDGVLDANDKCPNTPLTDKVDVTGCSIFMEKEVRETLEILFAHESAVIGNPDASKIKEFADFMKRFPNTVATIEGHTSAPGSEAYNMDLSDRRAKAVKVLLSEIYNIDAARLKTIGYGESRLLDTSNTSEAHRVNRRIEAVVTANEKVKLKR